MVLEVLGSSSKGNCYLLRGERETLILEAGISIKEIKQALKFNISQVVGCIITHEHQDHSKSAIDLHNMGIPVYATKGTREALKLPQDDACTMVPEVTTVKAGGFIITAYDAKHDAAEPCIYLIFHPRMGNMLFATDTYLIPYDFRGLQHYLIEANYSEKILNEKVEKGELHVKLAQRIIKSHLSLERVLNQVRNSEEFQTITLIHLSDSNSNAEEFKKEVQRATGKPVYIADTGLKVNIWRGI